METAIIGALIQAGTVGAVAAWFMFRAEGKLDALARAVNRLALAAALEVATRPTADEKTRTLARELADDVKADNRRAPAPATA